MKCSRCGDETKGQTHSTGCRSAVCDRCSKKKAPAGKQRTPPGTKPGRPAGKNKHPGSAKKKS